MEKFKTGHFRIPFLVTMILLAIVAVLYAAGSSYTNTRVNFWGIADSNLSGVAISGSSTIDNTIIGATTPAVGKFTTLTINGVLVTSDTELATSAVQLRAEMATDTELAATAAQLRAEAATDTELAAAVAAAEAQLRAEAATDTELTNGLALKLSKTLDVLDKDTDYVVLSTDTGKIITNTGAGVSTTLTLPTPAKGLSFIVTKVAAQNLKVVAGSGAILGTTNNSLVTSTAGSAVRVVGVSTTQWSTLQSGTWTDTTTLP